MNAAEPIAIVRAEDGYDGLLRAFKARRNQLNVSGLVLDDIAGFASGHTTKIHAGLKGLGPMSLGAMLGSHAMMLVAIEDAEALELIKSRLCPRDEKQVMRGAGKHRETIIRISRATFKKMATAGAYARCAKLSKKQRSKIAKIAAQARWQRAKSSEEQGIPAVRARRRLRARAARARRAANQPRQGTEGQHVRPSESGSQA